MIATIVDQRVAGTRITVWDILHYLEGNWSFQEIADVLRLSVEQVQVAAQYIDEHREAVMAVHRQIEERNARGNPPEIEAKLAESRAALQAWLVQRQKMKHDETHTARDTCRP